MAKTSTMKDRDFLKALEKADRMKADGANWDQIKEATGLNYSQAWYFIEMKKRQDAGLPFFDGPDSPNFGATVVALRNGEKAPKGTGTKESWGMIAVLCRCSESQVRKAFAERSGKVSQGLRKGRGGRWVFGDATLYQDELRVAGVELSSEVWKLALRNRDAARAEAMKQRLVHRSVEELRELAKAERVRVEGGVEKATKAALTKAILGKFRTDEPATKRGKRVKRQAEAEVAQVEAKQAEQDAEGASPSEPADVTPEEAPTA